MHGSGHIFPRQAIAPPKSAKRNLAAVNLYGSLRLPLAVNEIVHGKIDGLGLHVASEETAD